MILIVCGLFFGGILSIYLLIRSENIGEDISLIPLLMILVSFLYATVCTNETTYTALEIKESHRLPERILVVDENGQDHFFTDVSSYKTVMSNAIIYKIEKKSLVGIVLDRKYELREKE